MVWCYGICICVVSGSDVLFGGQCSDCNELYGYNRARTKLVVHITTFLEAIFI